MSIVFSVFGKQTITIPLECSLECFVGHVIESISLFAYHMINPALFLKCKLPQYCLNSTSMFSTSSVVSSSASLDSREPQSFDQVPGIPATWCKLHAYALHFFLPGSPWYPENRNQTQRFPEGPGWHHSCEALRLITTRNGDNNDMTAVTPFSSWRSFSFNGVGASPNFRSINSMQQFPGGN